MFKIDAHQVAGHTGLAASRRARVTSAAGNATRSFATGFGSTDFAMYPCGWQGNTPTTISHKAWRPKESSP